MDEIFRVGSALLPGLSTPRMRHALGTALATVAFAFGASWSSGAVAADEFDVAVAKGQVVVRVKGDWHINADYPWKLSIGEAKLDRTMFRFDEKSARVDGAPSGKGTVRGGICAGTRCKSFTEEITIP
jgi:hypothetical protein